MSAAPKLREVPPADPVDPLALLREPFKPHQISKLPKPTKKQTDEVKADFKKGIRCKECGSWHHPDVVHLDYVGHAALTDRLLDVDPHWAWEPVADPAGAGLPVAPGGMWIKLTVCGVSRYGFGHPDGKTGGDAVKETIGDALRNAAMRFGAALDLWHKGDLHGPDDAADGDGPAENPPPMGGDPTEHAAYKAGVIAIDLCGMDEAKLTKWKDDNAAGLDRMDKPVFDALKRYWQAAVKRARAEPKAAPPADDFGIPEDEIPF